MFKAILFAFNRLFAPNDYERMIWKQSPCEEELLEINLYLLVKIWLLEERLSKLPWLVDDPNLPQIIDIKGVLMEQGTKVAALNTHRNLVPALKDVDDGLLEVRYYRSVLSHLIWAEHQIEQLEKSQQRSQAATA